MLHQLEKNLSSQTLLLWHFLIFGIGLLKLTWMLTLYISKHYIDMQPIAAQVCDWVAPFANDKLLKLLYFGSSLLILGLYYFFFAVVDAVAKKLDGPIFSKSYLSVDYLLLILILNLLLLNNNMTHVLFIFTVLWAILFLILPARYGIVFFCSNFLKDQYGQDPFHGLIHIIGGSSYSSP